MIPPIDRKEWYELITGAIEPRFNSSLLKIKISILRRKVNRGILTPKQAIEELMNDCKNHFELYRLDLHQIFREKREKNSC